MFKCVRYMNLYRSCLYIIMFLYYIYIFIWFSFCTDVVLIIKMQRSFMNVCFCGLPNHLVWSWTCEWYILYSLISLRFFCSCVQCLDQTRINMHIIPIYHTYFTKSVVSFNWCAKAPELLRDRISFCSSFKVPRSRSRRRFDEACHAENGGCFNRDWVDLFHGWRETGEACFFFHVNKMLA